jgi:hypothetical protein
MTGPLNRRSLLGRGAAAAVSGIGIGAAASATIPAAPASMLEDDSEILDLAMRCQEAEAEFSRSIRACDDQEGEALTAAEAARDAASEATLDLRWQLINEPPNTVGGVRVILEALLRDSYLSDEDVNALAENLLDCPALAVDAGDVA